MRISKKTILLSGLSFGKTLDGRTAVSTDSENAKSCNERCISRSDFNFKRFEIIGSRIVIIGETEVRIYNPDILFENKFKLETNSNSKFDCSRTGYGDGKLCDNVITNVVGNGQEEGCQLWVCGSNSRNPLLYQVNLGNNFHWKEFPALDFCPKSFNINSSALWLADKSSLILVMGELNNAINVKFVGRSTQGNSLRYDGVPISAKQFNDPSFKFITVADQKVFLFYNDYLHPFLRTSRKPHIGSLCLNDAIERSNSLSFVKAQLICKHLDYEFDVLMSVVPGVLDDSQGYFALFSSKHKYFIKQTAICFYSIEAINRLFSNSNSFYDNETFETKKWPPTTLKSDTAHPKDCRIGNNELIKRKSADYTLLTAPLDVRSFFLLSDSNQMEYGGISVIQSMNSRLLIIGTSKGFILFYAKYTNLERWKIMEVINEANGEEISQIKILQNRKILIRTKSFIKAVNMPRCARFTANANCKNKLFCSWESGLCIESENRTDYLYNRVHTDVVTVPISTTTIATSSNITPSNVTPSNVTPSRINVTKAKVKTKNHTTPESMSHHPTQLSSPTLLTYQHKVSRESASNTAELSSWILFLLVALISFCLGSIVMYCIMRRRILLSKSQQNHQKRPSSSRNSRKDDDSFSTGYSPYRTDSDLQSPERKRGPSHIITSPSHHKGQWQRGNLIKEEESLLKSNDNEAENKAHIDDPTSQTNSQNHSMSSSEAGYKISQEKTTRRPPSMGINSLHNTSLNNNHHS